MPPCDNGSIITGKVKNITGIIQIITEIIFSFPVIILHNPEAGNAIPEKAITNIG